MSIATSAMTDADAASGLDQFRYAVYLIPPYDVARRVTEVHTILRKQFGFTAADKFQIHATLKGFFKCSMDCVLVVRGEPRVSACRSPGVQSH